MKKLLFLLCLLSLVACTRGPAGRFGVSTDTPNLLINNEKTTAEEVSLERLEEIEEVIDEKVDKMNDDSIQAGDLSKLVNRDNTDPALLYDRDSRNQALIEAKFDEKIEKNLLSEDSDSELTSTSTVDTDDSVANNDRDAQLQSEIDKRLDEEAADLIDDTEESNSDAQ